PGAAAQPNSGIFGLPFTPADAQVIVIPAPWAATASYGGGAERGPQAILEASRQVDLFDVQTGRPYEAGIAMLPIPREIEEKHREARALAEQVLAVGGAVAGN